MSGLRPLPPSTATFSAAVVTEGWLHVSGQVATQGDGQPLTRCSEQARECLKKIDALLSAAGATRSDVVKLTAFLVSADDFPSYQAEKAAWVASPAPAGTAVVVAGLLAPGARIEIEAIARVPT